MTTAGTKARELQAIGFTAFEAGRIQQAEEAFRLAAVVAPEEPDAWLGLGSALAQQGRAEEAAMVFAMAAIAAPDDAWPPLLAAEAHLAAGNLGKAIDALDWVGALVERGKVDRLQLAAATALQARCGRDAR